MSVLVQLLPLMVVQALFAIPVYRLAKRASKRPLMWLVFALIPGVGIYAMGILGWLALEDAHARIQRLERGETFR